MITRVRAGTDGSVLECIRQHDHAALSAALAEAWCLDGVLDDEVRFAVRFHDVAWVGLDHRVVLTAGGDPHSFLDHPLGPRYRALITGVDLVEHGSPYAGLLCSRHHARFSALSDDEASQAHLAHEQARQARLWSRLDAVQQARADADLALWDPARRTTVRATSRAAETRFSPGSTNSCGMAKRSVTASMMGSRADTMSAVTREVPSTSLARFSGAVASSAPTTKSSRCNRTSRSKISEPGSVSARATPSIETASSVAP